MINEGLMKTLSSKWLNKINIYSSGKCVVLTWEFFQLLAMRYQECSCRFRRVLHFIGWKSSFLNIHNVDQWGRLREWRCLHQDWWLNWIPGIQREMTFASCPLTSTYHVTHTNTQINVVKYLQLLWCLRNHFTTTNFIKKKKYLKSTPNFKIYLTLHSLERKLEPV